MTAHMKVGLFLLLAVVLAPAPLLAQSDSPPPAPREFRGAWIATVGNINWPSKPGLPVAEQQQEILNLLDYAARLKLNAIFIQVRPAADAMYASQIEPWSQYLTGSQGQPPVPFYDPLEFWVTEAHRRGIECHAWYNLYRARAGKNSNIAPNHIVRRHPEIIREYGNLMWMDPGEPVAMEHTLNVILDIVRRYDVDGVHTDDYYYPYVEKDKADKPIDFPDAATYARYRQRGGTLDRPDWRRDNINRLVQRVDAEVHKIKPWVKVSYGPFGIWKPDAVEGVEGMSQYDDLYADPKLWLNNGWVDFLSPQLYWPIEGKQSFPKLLEWWVNESTAKRWVWPGLGVARHDTPQLMKQIEIIRRQPLSRGMLFWNIERVRDHKDKFGDALMRGPFRTAALIPPMPWRDSKPPPAPRASGERNRGDGAVTIALNRAPGEPPIVYAVWARYGQQWRFLTVPAGAPSLQLNPDPAAGPATAVVVTAVDRCGNESDRVDVRIR